MNFFRFNFEADGEAAEIATPLSLRKESGSQEVKGKAVWDTGATSSMISAETARKLQLQPIGVAQISGVHGIQNTRVYKVDFVFENGFVIPGVKVSEASNFGGFDLLVGMDIIGKGQMLIDGTSDRLRARFFYPM